jgi:basic amino acid/polyamine antiporter, APA family
MAGLKKDLGLLGVFSIATGTTLSAGFFLLPGLAAREAGPAVVVSYLLAALFLIPPLFSVVELATAMPRAGGAYYFLDRSMGPLIGTIGGFSTWIVLVLKTSFALFGMGAYVRLFLPSIPALPLALAFAILFGAVNLVGAATAGSAQIFLVAGLLVLVGLFVVVGLPSIELHNFEGLFDAGADAVIATAGMVYVSYVGVTHVASVSEEISDPEKNLPRGLFLSVGTIIVVYGLGIFVIVGLVPADELHQSLTPVAAAAEAFAGRSGTLLVTVAAILAFSSVANAGVLSASRYPLALSRDELLPPHFARLSPRGVPLAGVAATVSMIIFTLLVLDAARLAKLASTFQLIVLALLSGAVIVMRESHIRSYDPGSPSPAYPWMQIAGIAGPVWLIGEMGWIAILPAMMGVATAAGWYHYYARDHIVRDGAIYHIFERLGRRRYEGLDRELRSILKEKGLREQDPFEEVVTRAVTLDLVEGTTFEEATRRAVSGLKLRLPASETSLVKSFLEETRLGATPVSGGVALPHLRLAGLDHTEMAIVRVRGGLRLEPLAEGPGQQAPIHALFFLVSPEEDPGRHLRILAAVARRVDDEHFLDAWLTARDGHELKQIMLREERALVLELSEGRPAADWIGRALRDIRIPEGCLVAMVGQASGRTIVPRGRTVLRAGDRLTLIGDPDAILALRAELGAGGGAG